MKKICARYTYMYIYVCVQSSLYHLDLQVHDCSFYSLLLVSSDFLLVFNILSGVSKEFNSFPFLKNALQIHHTMQIKADSILKIIVR